MSLYDDELHDFGDMSLSVKLRVMPTCWFALLRCWVRVDSVGLRAVETRFFCKFGGGSAPVVYRCAPVTCPPSHTHTRVARALSPRRHCSAHPARPALHPSPKALKGVACA